MFIRYQTLHGLVHYFGQFSSPNTFRYDNGSHFVNEAIEHFLLQTGTTHDKTMAYSSEENAIVERCSKEINRYIEAFTFDRSTSDNYQEIIPFVTQLLNTNANERKKVSPAQLVYGNSINLDKGILIQYDETELTHKTMTHSSSKMLAQQHTLMRIA